MNYVNDHVTCDQNTLYFPECCSKLGSCEPAPECVVGNERLSRPLLLDFGGWYLKRVSNLVFYAQSTIMVIIRVNLKRGSNLTFEQSECYTLSHFSKYGLHSCFETYSFPDCK